MAMHVALTQQHFARCASKQATQALIHVDLRMLKSHARGQGLHISLREEEQQHNVKEREGHQHAL